MSNKLVPSIAFIAFFSTAAHAVPDDPLHTEDIPDKLEVCETVILAKHNALLAAGVAVGSPVGTMQRTATAQFCWQDFTGGRIYSVEGTGVAVVGAIWTEYGSVGTHTGFGWPRGDRQTASANNYKQHFQGGWIHSHPTWGTHAIYNLFAGPWIFNGGYTGRFGYPTSDRVLMPGNIGTYYSFQYGFGMNTPELGTWLDYTAGGEGRSIATATLYSEAGLWGSTFSRTFANETPIAFAAQLGTMDNVTSSLRVTMPARASLTLFDGNSLSSRSVTVTGANLATVNVSNIGAFMNDRTSSVLFANHGYASVRRDGNQLGATIDAALDAAVDGGLMDTLLAGHDASGSLTWTGPSHVSFVPGSRAIRVQRRAFMDIDADCLLIFTCDADGDVDFVVNMRPEMTGEFSIRVVMISGTATSISCSGDACGARADILAGLFTGVTDAKLAVEDTFNATLDTMFAPLPLLAGSCPGVSVKRINVLPGFVEIVLADNQTVANCAAPIASDAGQPLSTARPTAQVLNSDGTVITQGVTTVPLP